MQTIEWPDFEKIELIAGTIIEIDDFPEARKPAYKLKIDLDPDYRPKLAAKALV